MIGWVYKCTVEMLLIIINSVAQTIVSSDILPTYYLSEYLSDTLLSKQSSAKNRSSGRQS